MSEKNFYDFDVEYDYMQFLKMEKDLEDLKRQYDNIHRIELNTFVNDIVFQQKFKDITHAYNELSDAYTKLADAVYASKKESEHAVLKIAYQEPQRDTQELNEEDYSHTRKAEKKQKDKKRGFLYWVFHHYPYEFILSLVINGVLVSLIISRVFGF